MIAPFRLSIAQNPRLRVKTHHQSISKWRNPSHRRFDSPIRLYRGLFPASLTENLGPVLAPQNESTGATFR
jgi:hypothetical protein